MSLNLRSSLNRAIRCLSTVKPAIQPNHKQRTFENVEKNIALKKPPKAWQKAGEEKDQYFKRRFAHVHAKQKENDYESRRSRFQDQRDLKRQSFKSEIRDDRQRHKSKFGGKDIMRRLSPNPLSEFIYGKSAVTAALKANKREFFNNLYIAKKLGREDEEIAKLATELGVKITFLTARGALDQMTKNAVHNGYVLETKPLQPASVVSLGPVEGSDYTINEDNFGDVLPQPYQTLNPNPLGIYIDGVTDPHNVGAIARSAYFFGADFLITSEKNTATLSPVVTKVSVGATEFLPIMTASKPLQFFEKSKSSGWTFIAAGSTIHERDPRIAQTLQSKSVHMNDLNALLEKGPCVLVLGSEGEGIRTTLKLRSDFLVEIESGKNVDPLVDSLNVSVASAMLIQKTLNP